GVQAQFRGRRDGALRIKEQAADAVGKRGAARVAHARHLVTARFQRLRQQGHLRGLSRAVDSFEDEEGENTAHVDNPPLVRDSSRSARLMVRIREKSGLADVAFVFMRLPAPSGADAEESRTIRSVDSEETSPTRSPRDTS